MSDGAAAAEDPAAPLPGVVPIFPLPGVLLLPRTQLPLHVFEPRYRAMMRDAVAGDGVIAMIQPSGMGGAEDPMNPAVYPIGCLGRIAASQQLEDGRWNLVLTGLSRFRITEELPLHADGYRLVSADYAPYAGDRVEDSAAIDRARLVGALRRLLTMKNLGTNWDAIDKTADEALVNALAMGMPFAPSEKQALLESRGLAERAETLIALCEMATLAANDDSPRH